MQAVKTDPYNSGTNEYNNFSNISHSEMQTLAVEGTGKITETSNAQLVNERDQAGYKQPGLIRK